MGSAKKVKLLLTMRDMTIKDLSEKIEPKTTAQNLAAKLRRDNLTDKDLQSIAEACNATYDVVFTLNDTGKQI